MRVAIITVCGLQDIDYLRATAPINAKWGWQLVLEDLKPYNDGLPSFDLVGALNHQLYLAKEKGYDVAVHLDPDEYMINPTDTILAAAEGNLVEILTLHHIAPGLALEFSTEWHTRAFPLNGKFQYEPNHRADRPYYHPLLPPATHRSYDLHHHLHFAVGRKRFNQADAREHIPGWPMGRLVQVPAWPPSVKDVFYP